MLRYILILLFFAFQVSNSQWEYFRSKLSNVEFMDYVVTDSVIYAATNKGVYYSSNSGSDWNQINGDMVLNKNVFPVYISSINSNLFVAVLESFGQGLIYRSDDNGKNWKPLTSLSKSFIRDMSVKDSILYVPLSSKGLFYSTDLGILWQAYNTEFTDLPINNLWIAGSYFFICSKDGGFLSSDNGFSWNKINTGFDLKYYGAFTYLKNKIIVANDSNGLLLSNDGGRNWIQKEIMNTNSKNAKIRVLLNNDNIIFAGGYDGLWISTDVGEMWYQVPKMVNVNCLSFKDGYLLVGAGDGFSARAKIIDLLPPVGVYEKNPSNSKVLSVSPNLSSNQIRIRLNDDLSRFSIGRVEISSNIGEKLLSIPIDEVIYSQGIDLGVSAYPSGLYFCTVRTGSHVETQLFLVIH
jgi:photosystem II stability/assembly factor-like uncharacterized protein